MKKMFFSALLLNVAFVAFGQSKYPPLDKSPMDMSYYPVNYPIQKIQDKVTEPLLARVIYSRPQKNGRLVFGELLEYGKVWRLGANEATEIEFYKDVKIGGTKIKKGRYTLYCLPTSEKWTLIVNKDIDIWGAFKYDAKKDIARIDLPVQHITEIQEAFTMFFEKNNGGVNLIMTWDDDLVKMPITF
jgi:Protein of unknown function (DUF2911)